MDQGSVLGNFGQLSEGALLWLYMVTPENGLACATGSPAQGGELDSDMPLLWQAFQTAEACRLAYPGQDWLHLVRAPRCSVCGLVAGRGPMSGRLEAGLKLACGLMRCTAE